MNGNFGDLSSQTLYYEFSLIRHKYVKCSRVDVEFDKYTDFGVRNNKKKILKPSSFPPPPVFREKILFTKRFFPPFKLYYISIASRPWRSKHFFFSYTLTLFERAQSNNLAREYFTVFCNLFNDFDFIYKRKKRKKLIRRDR